MIFYECFLKIVLDYGWFTILMIKWFSFTYTLPILFHIIFPYGLLLNIEYNFLCHTVGLCWLFILYIVFVYVNSKLLVYPSPKCAFFQTTVCAHLCHWPQRLVSPPPGPWPFTLALQLREGTTTSAPAHLSDSPVPPVHLYRVLSQTLQAGLGVGTSHHLASGC